MDQSQFQQVKTMNIAFGNKEGDPRDFMPQEDAPPNEIWWDAKAWQRLEKQCKNILDEVNELETAIMSLDIDGVRDANCDIRVFTYGGAHFMGYAIPDEAHPVVYVSQNEILGNLRAVHAALMHAISRHAASSAHALLGHILHLSNMLAQRIGQDLDEDMKIVVDAVMTRFVKDEDDLGTTIEMHAAKGVHTTYTEGEYPTLILKSAEDQPDAPKGKFLKSASCEKPVFRSLQTPMVPATQGHP